MSIEQNWNKYVRNLSLLISAYESTIISTKTSIKKVIQKIRI